MARFIVEGVIIVLFMTFVAIGAAMKPEPKHEPHSPDIHFIGGN